MIRPSPTRSTVALWAKSLLNAVLFFCVFMLALPWLTHRLLSMQLPMQLPFPRVLRTWLAGLLALVGITQPGSLVSISSAGAAAGRGTPLPAVAPRHLVTTGLFGKMRNPIMAAELLVIWAVALYAIAISLTAHVMVVHIEEPELRERFGKSYEDYCRTVPRWLPRLTWRS